MVGSHSSEEVQEDIKKRINEVTESPRKNAVLTIEVLQTFSPESKISLSEWKKDNIKWLKEHFGEKNVISSTLHLDETTPHIVSYVVPEKNGKLNCREILGGREKLQKLQDSYASKMEKHNLERGIKNSKSEHTTIKKYYSKVNDANANAFQLYKSLPKINNPPEKKLFQSKAKREEQINKWKKSYLKKYNLVCKNYGKNILENDVLRYENTNLKNSNSELLEKIERLEKMINFEEISKDDIKVLRKLDISKVAERLGFTGEVNPKENAIDLVNRVNNFGFQDSVVWLYHEFGQDYAASSVSEFMDVKKPERPFSPAENAIKQVVAKQLDALGCDKFRITIQSDTAKPFLPGKPGGKDSDEKFYSKSDIKNMIPYLRYENNQSKNIFITPMDENAFYILLDDSKISLKQLEDKGFKPCLYQKTSWNSSQAVFKISKDFDREKEVIPFFNKMNRSWGDEKITGLRHPFRLAGFRNMKEKHKKENGLRPFVEIQKSVNRFCDKCMDMIKSQFRSPEQKDHFPSSFRKP